MISRVRRLHFKFRRRTTSLSQETHVKVHDTYHVFSVEGPPCRLTSLCRYWVGPAMSVLVHSKQISWVDAGQSVCVIDSPPLKDNILSRPGPADRLLVAEYTCIL